MKSVEYNTLAAGIAQLGLEVGDDKVEKLLGFLRLIQKWNKAYNLTAVLQPIEMVRLHLLDSLAILSYINSDRVIDIGTGAGLPGIPLAICQPNTDFVLLDSNAKKTRFVQQVVVELQLRNVNVSHARVESYHAEQKFATVITRAFASMADIQQLAGHLLADNGEILAMKGRPSEQELQQIKGSYWVYPLQIPNVAADRCLVKYAKA